MVKTRKECNKNRRKLSSSLENKLNLVKDFKGEYEFQRDYKKVYEKLKNTNPFSILVFYERSENKISLAKIKKLNPFLPERMLAGFASYVQFYFTPELKEMRLGSNPGSGYRSTQSTYVLSLALLSKKIDIPTDILILDQKATMKHVLSSKKLIVQPHEVTQTVEKSVADKILKNTICAYRIGSFDKIESIYLVRPQKGNS